MRLVSENTKQQECVDKTIAWLHYVWDVTEKGRFLDPDPFYERNELLTPEVVKKVIDNIETIFMNELRQYPGYHRNAQGISGSEYLVPPGFDRMSAGEQLAVVQGIDRIFQDYRETDSLVLTHTELLTS